MSEDRNILNFIRTICANGESGRLEILAGAIQGELSFAEGKLVDARVGHLSGFRAINAVASMRDARFSFDPAFTPLASSSITASERVVLKQFFGIDAAAANEYLEPVMWTEEAVPAATAAPIADTPDEVTIVSSSVTNDTVPIPVPHASRFAYRTAFAVAALVIAVVAAAAVLIYRSRERSAPAAVAARVQTVSSSAPVEQAEAVAVNSMPSQPVPAPAAPVKREEKSARAAADLSGKWSLVNVVEATSYKSFKNLKIGFDLAIKQTGTSFTGNGLKVSENGRSLPAGSRTPIEVKGTINGDRIEATFFEQGTARKSNGRFVWRIDRAGRGLTGIFATNAARSRGKSAATREL